MTTTAAVAEESWDGVRPRRAVRVELAARYGMPDQETEPPTGVKQPDAIRDPGPAPVDTSWRSPDTDMAVSKWREPPWPSP